MKWDEGWLKHFPRKNSPGYVIATPRADEHESWWKSYKFTYYHAAKKPKWEEHIDAEYGVEYSALRRNLDGKFQDAFGLGLSIVRKSEGNLRLHIDLGRLISVWFKVDHEYLVKHFAIDKEKDPKHWYEDRKYGFQFFYAGAFLHFWWNASTMGWGEGYPGIDWNSCDLTRNVFGYETTDRELLEQGEIKIPLPEGVYSATWTRTRMYRHHTTPRGKMLDRVRRKPPWYLWEIEIPGGIPIEGKGENSYDCGMDGTFGLSTGACRNPQDLVGEVVKHVLRDRERYGGPYNLPCAMSVKDAAEWQKNPTKEN